jgi:predicted nuclease with RNAse H fold
MDGERPSAERKPPQGPTIRPGSRVVGVDLAADPRHTGVAILIVEANEVTVAIDGRRGSDEMLVEFVHDADVVGIDAPLGWPEPFATALALHQRGEPWPEADDPIQQRRLLSKRRTDRLVKETTGIDPLPVAADRIGAVAMRCARLQTLWAEGWGGLEDRSGRGRLVETYPAAALKQWGLAHRRYKGHERVTERAALVESLVQAAPWLDLGAAVTLCRESDHTLDAVVSALIALAARLGFTHSPTTPADFDLAVREGWIHLPSGSLFDLGEALDVGA